MTEIEIRCGSCFPARRRALSIWVVVVGMTTLGVSVSGLVLESRRTPPPKTACHLMGGQCLPRLQAGVGECRLASHTEANRAVTWVQRNPKLHWNSLVCPEHLHCCIEDPCESVLGGECATPSACSGEEGKTTYPGFCPSPRWGAADVCCA